MKMHSPISKKYGAFLKELMNVENKPRKDISRQICYDLFRIREYQWQYKVEFSREVDSPLSEIFQDIIAHYLKAATGYEVLCEHKQGKLRPDILIREEGKNKAVIEVKTTIGYDRNLVRKGNYMKRLKALSKEFNVPLKRTFYIFEGANNVTRGFSAIFESNKRHKIKRSIYPLFHKTVHPYFVSNIRDRKRKYHKCRASKINEFYLENKLTDFEDILKKIR